jgi:hypothetical protein
MKEKSDERARERSRAERCGDERQAGRRAERMQRLNGPDAVQSSREEQERSSDATVQQEQPEEGGFAAEPKKGSCCRTVERRARSCVSSRAPSEATTATQLLR